MKTTKNNWLFVSFLLAASVTLFTTSVHATALLQLLSINDGDPTVRQWAPSTGAYLGVAATLTYNGSPFLNNSDIEFDGQFYYSISPTEPKIRRFDAAGQYLDYIPLLSGAGDPFPQAQCGLATDGQFFYTIAENDYRIRRFDL